MAISLYEAMFVVDASKGGSEFPNVIRHTADLLTRHGAEIERIERWDERKFAYPIKHVKRGIYILTYFRVDGSAISELRRDIVLSEDVLRVLILAVEQPNQVSGQLFNAEGEQVETPVAPPAPAPPAPAAEGGEGAAPAEKAEVESEAEEPEPEEAEEAEQPQ